MRLVDTSAWIEWLTGSRVGGALEAELPPSREWLVPTMAQLELARWLTREASDDKADQVIGFTATCLVASLAEIGYSCSRQALDLNYCHQVRYNRDQIGLRIDKVPGEFASTHWLG
jgi:uncharacterized protein with PIN domain